ncbi:MAG TPA: hypothetical protein VLV48_05960, partial [Thermoanaerobaculia bacterium]|nr:hypothetical protein [Thermoanaerobaculia bacterium]
VLYVALPRWLADRRVGLLLIAVLCADLLWSARPLLAHGRLTYDRSGWSARLDPPWRFVRVTGPEAKQPFPRADRWLLGYKNLYARRFDLATPAPVVPSRFLSFYRAATRGDRDDLVDLASVRWILSTRAKLRRGYVATGKENKDVRLYDNRGAFPPVQFWSGAAVAGQGDPLERLLSRGFDARRGIEVAPAPAVPAGGARVEVRSALRFDGSSAAATLDAPAAGVVVLTQLAADGWRVEVDGAPARALVVDGILRGVEIGAGTHEVRWVYRPFSLYGGGAVTAVALLVLAVFAVRNRWLRSPDDRATKVAA